MRKPLVYARFGSRAVQADHGHELVCGGAVSRLQHACYGHTAARATALAGLDTRYKWTCLLGVLCPERAVGAGLVMPRANVGAMNLHLAEISKAVTPGAHAVLVLDGAGWHVSKQLVVPDNISLLKLSPYSPELNPIENVWADLRGTKIAHRLFDTCDDIVNACCEAWNSFLADPKTIQSVTTRQWATCQQS